MRPWVALVFAFSLLQAQGSSAVTPLFVQTGRDVPLNVNISDVPERFISVEWKFGTHFLVRFFFNDDPSVSPDYKTRIEFSAKKFSVTLKNLQEADKGVYTATVTRRSAVDKKLSEYDVSVLDPVSPVNLTVDSRNSSDSCNVTATCSTGEYQISSTFRCDNQPCHQEGGEQLKVTTSGVSIRVYLQLNGSVICNHSNQVSSTTAIKAIEQFCPRNSDSTVDQTHVPVIVVVSVLILVIIIIIVIFAVQFLRKKKKYNTECIENTVYEVPQVGTSAITLDTRPKPDTSDQSSTSTYCLVGPHSRSLGSTETKGTTPESVYAQVEKSARSLKS